MKKLQLYLPISIAVITVIALRTMHRTALIGSSCPGGSFLDPGCDGPAVSVKSPDPRFSWWQAILFALVAGIIAACVLRLIGKKKINAKNNKD